MWRVTWPTTSRSATSRSSRRSQVALGQDPPAAARPARARAPGRGLVPVARELRQRGAELRPLHGGEPDTAVHEVGPQLAGDGQGVGPLGARRDDQYAGAIGVCPDLNAQAAPGVLGLHRGLQEIEGTERLQARRSRRPARGRRGTPAGAWWRGPRDRASSGDGVSQPVLVGRAPQRARAHVEAGERLNLEPEATGEHDLGRSFVWDDRAHDDREARTRVGQPACGHRQAV